MLKFHSTVSRRDFMKCLGMATAGLGAAAAATPVFHDMDELMAAGGSSTPQVKEKWPWWVKEREYLDSTTEVDWNILERYNRKAYNNTTAFYTPEHYQQVEAARHLMRVDRINRGYRPRTGDKGYGLRDYALIVSGWMNSGGYPGYHKMLGEPDSRIFGVGTNFIPEGSPRWEGTPEENSHMMRVVSRLMGAGRVGFGQLHEATTKKMVQLNAGDAGSNNIVFEDVPKPYAATGKWVMPNSCRYLLLPEIRMRREELLAPNSAMCRGMVGKAYSQIDIFGWRITSFMKAIGWNICSTSTSGLTPGRAGFAVLFGMGEMGRVHAQITPEFGPDIRCAMDTYTDLPLAQTNPIDCGMARFCQSCTKCADMCPGAALSYDKEQSWETGGYHTDYDNPDYFDASKFNQPGKKVFWLNHMACRSVWRNSDASCSICYANCVFTKDRIASIHELVKPIVANTGIFNGFFFNMDKAYKYGEYSPYYLEAGYEPSDPDPYWEGYLPPVYGLSTNY